MVENEAAEYMVASLAGQYHPALLARPGSGVIFDGARKRWILESDGTDCDMYVTSFIHIITILRFPELTMQFIWRHSGLAMS